MYAIIVEKKIVFLFSPSKSSVSLNFSVFLSQVQNLALRGARGIGVKTEAPERGDSGRVKNNRSWPPNLADSKISNICSLSNFLRC